jgi:hypothetical protein
MDDTYDVGIRLVLENGVSAGLGGLHRDLEAYDRSLAATVGRLHGVRELGRNLVRSVQPASAVAGFRHSREKGGERPAATEVADRPGKVAVKTPASAQSRERVLVRPPRLDEAEPTPRPRMSVPIAVRPASSARQERSEARTSTARESRKELPATNLATRLPARVATLPVYQQAASRIVAVRGTRIVQREMSIVPSPGDRNGVQREVLALRADPAPAASSGATMAAGSWLPPARRIAPAAAMVARKDPPGEGASASAGPIGGDVYLDGAHVGRWIADWLGKESVRPQGGLTGFDPRVSPAWPGSLHGT